MCQKASKKEIKAKTVWIRFLADGGSKSDANEIQAMGEAGRGMPRTEMGR